MVFTNSITPFWLAQLSWSVPSQAKPSQAKPGQIWAKLGLFGLDTCYERPGPALLHTPSGGWSHPFNWDFDGSILVFHWQ